MFLLLAVASHLFVRWIHVASMAVLLGGAAVIWGHLRLADDGAVAAAESYEWLFWAATGLVVLTGVGNLGAMAPAVPGPATDWGVTFALKLAAVGGLLAGSLVRTMAVARWRAGGGPTADRLRGAYVATTVYLLVLVALAEVLAHG